MTSRVDKFGDMARVFHALGNNIRLGIMMLLAEGEMNVTTLCKRLKLSETTVSGHLALLREGGLVVNRRDGYFIFYSHADLSKHLLGGKSRLSKPGSNAAMFGPAELALPKK